MCTELEQKLHLKNSTATLVSNNNATIALDNFYQPNRKPGKSVTFREVILMWNIIVQFFEHHKQNCIHLHYIKVEAEIKWSGRKYLLNFGELSI